jgi:hypothetical protein
MKMKNRRKGGNRLAETSQKKMYKKPVNVERHAKHY